MLEKDKVIAELYRRHSAVLSRVTPDELSSGFVKGVRVRHEHTYEILTSTKQNLYIVCSRRAGKTETIVRLLLLNALVSNPDSSSLYLALVSGQARKVWQRMWKRLLHKHKIGAALVTHSETEMTSTFFNGSTVSFGGVDDLRHVQTLLGASMAGGIAVIDETQSGVSSVLRPLVEDVLGPMLDETNEKHPDPGRLVVAGTQPKVRAGYLYDLGQQIDQSGEFWGKFRFSRFQNPFLTDNDRRLQEHLSKYNLKITDPIVQANWMAMEVYDLAATAYGYSEVRNQWRGAATDWSRLEQWFPDGMVGTATFCTAPGGVDQFVIGLDPAATSDRFAIVLWGWSSISPMGLYQVGEWVTGRGADPLESLYFGVIGKLCKHYKVVGVIRDAGSASTTQDPAFLAEYNLVIEPAKKGKGSKKARVDRLKDLLGTGRAKILADSELEQDLKLARFEPDLRAEGKYEWTADCHPDVADAATYAIPRYIESIETKKKSSQQLEEDQERHVWTGPETVYGPGSDDPESSYDDTRYGGSN